MIRRRLLACSLLLFALAILIAVWQRQPFLTRLLGESHVIAIAAGLTFAVVAVLMLLTSFDEASPALLRLDWYLPVLRRLKAGETASTSFLARGVRRLVPETLQSNRKSKQRGPVRKFLRKLGLSWLASPVRRISQAVCLVTFLILFLYVCWPYDARPTPTGEQSDDWSLAEIKQETAELRLARATGIDWQPREGQTFFAVLEAEGQADETVSVAVQWVSQEPGSVLLRPVAGLTPELLDRLLTTSGTWSLSETDPTAWPDHYAENLRRKELIPAESFLIIDPLVSLSTAIAARSWVWSLTSAAAILIVCVLIPRGFCGYLCPLGTTIDLFDWAIGKRVTRFRVAGDGWWVHIKYYLLAGTLLAAVFGVLVSGFFSAIPVITRASLFMIDPVQSGAMRGWHLVPAMNLGQFLSIALFFAVLGLGFFRPRFWCKYVCPSGAVFSLGNLFRITERKVESSCIHCNKCVEICPFDAIKPDFTTRTTDCTLCQSCAGVCPTHAIKFVERSNLVELKVANDPPTHETAIGRRGFLSLAGGTAAAAVGGAGVSLTTKTFGARLGEPDAFLPVRPPGSVPEKEFLEMCIRCGECFKACPNNVLQPEGFEQGLEGLWSPMVEADWAGCESSCNACGQVCPTGAIRALPLEEKKAARMGLAIVNETTCLPFAGREACDLCVQECNAAGYHAIEYIQVGTEVDEQGVPIEGTGFSAPVVLADRCVGCGLCQTRCYGINVKEKSLLGESAIIIEAGEGKEDRMMSGSYLERRLQEDAAAEAVESDSNYFVPEADSGGDPFGVPESPPVDEEDPFGTLGL